MEGYLYFIIRGEDVLAERDQPIHVKIGRTGDPGRRISNYNAAYVGDRPPVYYRLLKVKDQFKEEVHALSVFEENRVKKGGSNVLSEVVLTTKEAVDDYHPLCRSAIAVDPLSLPRLEEVYARELRVVDPHGVEHSSKKRRGPGSAARSQRYMESVSEASVSHDIINSAVDLFKGLRFVYDPQGTVISVDDPSKLFFRVYSSPVRHEYWRLGYGTRVHIITTPYSSSRISDGRPYPGGLVDGSRYTTQGTRFRDFIGQNITLGNVILESVRLTRAQRIEAQETMKAERERGTLLPFGDVLWAAQNRMSNND
jgi:hypothetical protein